MGYSCLDDWIKKVTVDSKYLRYDWDKKTDAGVFVAGRWYDMSRFQGIPQQLNYGELVYNRNFTNGPNYWTLTGGFAWAADAMNHTTAAVTDLTGTLMKPFVNGRTYRTVFTMTRTTGGVRIGINGTLGTNRISTATFTENLVAGAAGGLTFTPTGAGIVWTIDTISVVELLQSFPLGSTIEGAPYLGAAVSPQTKHIFNAGLVGTVATQHPSTWMLVDLLMCYPGINMNTAGVQNLLNANVLPRYATGAGVRAFLVPQVAAGATPQNISISYTNSAGTPGKVMPVTVASTASAIAGHMCHAGINPNNFGPFLPMAAGDLGVQSVQSIQFSAASGAGEATLVLCKPLQVSVPIATLFCQGDRDLLNQFPPWPRVYDGACLGWLHFAGGAVVASSSATGYLELGWG